MAKTKAHTMHKSKRITKLPARIIKEIQSVAVMLSEAKIRTMMGNHDFAKKVREDALDRLKSIKNELKPFKLPDSVRKKPKRLEVFSLVDLFRSIHGRAPKSPVELYSKFHLNRQQVLSLEASRIAVLEKEMGPIPEIYRRRIIDETLKALGMEK